MEAIDRQKLLAELVDGARALSDALRGLTEEVAGRSPAPGRWSAREVVEHVAMVEEYLLSQIEAAKEGEPTLNEAREAAIRKRGTDRGRPFPAPEFVKPRGRFVTVAEAWEHFQATRARTIQYVESCGGDLHARITTHPLIGVVNCYETLLMMAIHPPRHALQIEEIRQALQGA